MYTVGKAQEEVSHKDQDDKEQHGFTLEDLFEAKGCFVPEIAHTRLSIRGLNGRWDVEE